MGTIVVVPKRKMLKPQAETAQPDVISPPSSVVIPPQLLSTLIVDTNKNWSGFPIENLGTPANNLGAARAYDLLSAIELTIDGGGSAITTGIKLACRLPCAGTIISAALGAPKESGSIVIDIWKDADANFPPTDADSITASAPPTITSAQNSLDATLTGWTKTFAVGDWLVLNVDSCTSITNVTLTLVFRRT